MALITSREATASKDVDRPTDAYVLSRYRDARLAEDFTELYRRHAGELYRYLVRYVGDSDLAEDILQETFLQIHTRCDLYRDGRPVRPWLYSLATHRAVDVLRRRRRPTVSLDEPVTKDETGSLVDFLAEAVSGPLEMLEEQERQRWVRDSLARLSDPLRQVLILAYYQDLPYAEIARILGLPLGTVKSRLHSALARLRTMAERYELTGGV